MTALASTLRHAVWYVKSDKLGKLWVGQHSMATDNLIYMILGGSSIAQGGFDVAILPAAAFLLARSNVSGNPGNKIFGETWGYVCCRAFDVWQPRRHCPL